MAEDSGSSDFETEEELEAEEPVKVDPKTPKVKTEAETPPGKRYVSWAKKSGSAMTPPGSDIPMASFAEARAELFKPDRGGMHLRERLRENQYSEIAEVIAGRLGYRYHGKLFTYPEVDKRREYGRLEATQARARLTHATMNTIADVLNTVGDEGTGPPVDRLSALSNQIGMLQQTLTVGVAQMPQRHFRGGGDGGPGPNVPAVPADSVIEPSTLLVANIRHAAAQVSTHVERNMAWTDLWHQGDETVRALFAELVAVLIQEACTRVVGRKHDPSKLRNANTRRCEVLNLLATITHGTDELWHLTYESTTPEQRRWGRDVDPVAAGMLFSGYLV